ncbi:TlpA family protein disulfide reductase [Parapedobacter tibetensis]|uniref:TlpA family protein disulfide reductase n=1 Tax=Parapedobacter tibetensis TaxID=2972951 RepID=UPI00214D1EFA|nr:TlpA disulfide reductase family protein [Parapedobacter tibetensis]
MKKRPLIFNHMAMLWPIYTLFIRTCLFPTASWNLRNKTCLLVACVGFMCAEARAQVPDSQSGPVPPGEVEEVQGLIIGDSVPEWFWDVELHVVNHPEGKSTVILGDFKDKLLVLDFWATYCRPCVASMSKWDTLQQDFEQEVAVVGIHLYHHNDLPRPFAQKQGWRLPIAVGNTADTLLNQLFYAQSRFGQVWIKDGKLLAIPKNKVVTKALVSNIVANKPTAIEMEESLTYFDPSFTQTKN